MQRLGEAAHFVQGGLRDLGHLAQLGAQRRTLRNLVPGARQHGADRGQNLPELVVQFARNVPQGGLLRRDQFLGQLAALGGERGQLREQLPVGADRIQSGQQDGHQRER